MISFSKQERIHPCHVSGIQLVELISIIKSDFSQSKLENDFTIRTNQEGVNIVEHDTDTFLGNSRLPKMLTKLSIDITGWEDGKITKKLSLTLYENYIDLDVTGSSETWVNGKFYQLKQYLTRTKPMLWFLQLSFISGGLMAVIGLGIVYGVTFSFFKFVYEDFLDLRLILLVVTLMVLGWAIFSQKYVLIYLEPKLSFVEKNKDLITVVSLICGVVSVIYLFI